MSMHIDLEQVDDVFVLRMKGRLTVGTDFQYLRGKAEEIKNSGCKKLLADFRDVPYIDSTVIAFLISVYTSVSRTEGGRFVLAEPSHRVKEVLDLMKLSEVIPMASSYESGLASLR